LESNVHSALWTTETLYLDDRDYWVDRGARYADHDTGEGDWLQTVDVTTTDTVYEETGRFLEELLIMQRSVEVSSSGGARRLVQKPPEGSISDDIGERQGLTPAVR
jgi:hypothetical protein